MSTPDPQPSQRIEHSSIQGSQIQQGKAGKNLTQVQADKLTQVYISVFGRDRRTDSEKLRFDVADQFLKNYIQPELKQRLRNTVYQDVWLTPGIEEQPHQVGELTPNRFLQVAGKPAETLDLQTTILEVFTQHKQLLILGEPGIGKTTTLLTLTDQLVEQALANPGRAIPVIFELSTWKDKDQSIEDWLTQQLTKTYRRVSAKIARGWLEKDLLIPLLDGLDELEPTRQEICVQRLNQFAEHYPYLVVCCRAEEYEAGHQLDELRSAVRLQPLTPLQIQGYLQQVGRQTLWEAVATHAEKQVFLQPDAEGKPGILQIPLFLRIVAEVGKPFAHQSELLEVYIDQRLSRDVVDWEEGHFKNKPWAYRNAHQEPNRQRTKHYLSWLSLYLQCVGKTEFAIEEIAVYETMIFDSVHSLYHSINRRRSNRRNITPNDLIDLVMDFNDLFDGDNQQSYQTNSSPDVKRPLTYYIGLIYIVLWLSITGIPFALTWVLSEKYSPDGNLIFAIFKGVWGIAMCYAVISPMSFYAIDNSLQRPQYRVNYRNSKSIIFIIFFTLFSITIFSFFGYLNWLILKQNNNSINLINQILSGFSVGVLLPLSLLYCLRFYPFPIGSETNENETKEWLPVKKIWNLQPNQGIQDSLKASLSITICLLTLWILLKSASSEIVGQPLSVLSALSIWSPITIFFGLIAGGMACVKHFSMRLVLFSIAKVIPWDYGRFLDYCVERRLLQRIGGRYRFLHRELLEHFYDKAGGVS